MGVNGHAILENQAPRLTNIDWDNPKASNDNPSDEQSPSKPECVPAEGERFFEWIAPGEDNLFQVIDDDKTPGHKPDKSLNKQRLGPHAQWAEVLTKLNQRGAAIFYTVNRTRGYGRKAEDIIGAPRALFVDLDEDGAAKLAAVRNCSRPPDGEIESSPGKYQVYWLNDGTIGREDFKRLQEQLAAMYGGDKGVCDLSRVMRVPGYLHQKDPSKPFRVRIVSLNKPPVGGNLRADIEAMTAGVSAAKGKRKSKGEGKDEKAGVRKPREECRALEWINQEAKFRWREWALDAFPEGEDHGDQLRISSEDLGRPGFEEDLSISAKGPGVRDFGQERIDPTDQRKVCYTPVEFIQAFFRYGENPDDDYVRVTEFNDAAASPIGGNISEEDACRCLALKLDIDWDAEVAREKEKEQTAGLNDCVAYSEDWIAQEFVDKYANDARYVGAWSQWFWRDGSRWAADKTAKAYDLIRKICRAAAKGVNEKKLKHILASSKTVAGAERFARSDRRMVAADDQWDRDLWALNTPAGIVDLKTGQLREHRVGDYCTKVTAVVPGGECPLWLSVLYRITNGDAELIGYLRRWFGYSLTGSTQEQCLAFFYGTGRNGKGVMVNTVSGILGDYHTTAPITAFTESATERHPTDLAGLRGARFVTAIETEQGKSWAEAKIKNLTGGDPIAARFMRGDFFEFLPQFKLLIAGNHKPQLHTVDEAIKSRIHLVPFVVFIPEKERDPRLTEKLREEWPGILQWMIDGCLEWQRRGLDPPKVVRDATAEYLDAEDTVGTWIADRCTRDRDAWESSTDLFQSWAGWARAAGEHVGTSKAFSQALAGRDGLKPHRMTKGAGFDGLKINRGREAENANMKSAGGPHECRI